MPKYVIIALLVVIGFFVIMNYWSKIEDKIKNKIIASIFGIICIGFIILISLLIF